MKTPKVVKKQIIKQNIIDFNINNPTLALIEIDLHGLNFSDIVANVPSPTSLDDYYKFIKMNKK